MPDGVGQSFLRDSQDFALSIDIQRATLSGRAHLDRACALALKIEADALQLFKEWRPTVLLRTQVQDAIAALHENFIGAIQHRLHHRFGARIARNGVGDDLEAGQQPLKPLQQRVVKFARDAHALRLAFQKSGFDLAGQMSNAQSNADPDRCARSKR